MIRTFRVAPSRIIRSLKLRIINTLYLFIDRSFYFLILAYSSRISTSLYCQFGFWDSKIRETFFAIKVSVAISFVTFINKIISFSNSEIDKKKQFDTWFMTSKCYLRIPQRMLIYRSKLGTVT